MRRATKTLLTVSALVMVLGSGLRVLALEHPVTYWTIEGTVKDWASKQPVAGAMVLVFLEKSPHMHFGFNPEQTDYPELPRTSRQGTFSALAVLYGGTSKDRPAQVEVIVVAPEYRTERFTFEGSQVQQVHEGGRQAIRIPDVEIITYQDLDRSVVLVPTPEEAEKLARLAVQRHELDTSAHQMGTPESIQEITWNGREAWRVSFTMQKPVKGGQIVVLIDKHTGRSTIGAGE